MFSLRKRKQDIQNLIPVEKKSFSSEIENCIEIYLESMNNDINKIIYQKLMEKSTNL